MRTKFNIKINWNQMLDEIENKIQIEKG
jgi:hypothetical protein